MRDTFYMHTITMQYTDDVVVMYTFNKVKLDLWGWTRVQTRAGVHIGTSKASEFYASLRDSVENALEHVFMDAIEERLESGEHVEISIIEEHAWRYATDPTDLTDLPF